MFAERGSVMANEFYLKLYPNFQKTPANSSSTVDAVPVEQPAEKYSGRTRLLILLAAGVLPWIAIFAVVKALMH